MRGLPKMIITVLCRTAAFLLLQLWKVIFELWSTRLFFPLCGHRLAYLMNVLANLIEPPLVSHPKSCLIFELTLKTSFLKFSVVCPPLGNTDLTFQCMEWKSIYLWHWRRYYCRTVSTIQRKWLDSPVRGWVIDWLELLVCSETHILNCCLHYSWSLSWQWGSYCNDKLNMKDYRQMGRKKR